MGDEEKISLTAISALFKTASEDSLRLNYLVRDIGLQKAQILKNAELVALIKTVKSQAVNMRQEKVANYLFKTQCVLNSLKCSLEMWGALKATDYDGAWVLLIDAQEYAQVAGRILLDNPDVSAYLKELSCIEQAVFPSWPGYMSPAFVEGGGKCSICGKMYADCLEHIEGYVYWGRLCQRVDRKLIRMEHAALVQKPRDKRCIIKHISTDEGKKRDYITWKVLDEAFESNAAPDAMVMSGVLYCNKELDFS